MRFLRFAFLTLVTTGAVAPPAAAQSPAGSQELRELRDEVARLREEIAALRKEVRDAHAPGAPHLREVRADGVAATPASAPTPTVAVQQTAPQEPQEPSLAAKVEMLQAQVAEQAQTKVESESRFPVKIFGAIAQSTFYNSRIVRSDQNPTLVNARTPSTPQRESSIGASLAQSQLGVLLDGPRIGSLSTSGVFAVDFAVGSSGPRILYAFVRLENDRSAIQFGQDHMVFAPNNPTSLAALSVPALLNSGNIYRQVPQLRYERRFERADAGTIVLQAALMASAFGGALNHAPDYQARIGWSKTRIKLGLSGHYARLNGFPPAPGIIETWGVALDYDLRFGRFSLGGEAFAGRNLMPLGGAAFQTFSQLDKTTGGFVEGRFRATEKLAFNLGFGTVRPFEQGQVFTTTRTDSNTSAFTNFIYEWTPEFATSLEYRWLSTGYGLGLGTPVIFDEVRRNHHVNLAFVYRF